MPSTFVSARTGQFAYFDAQLGHPDWTGKRVLDFGGNAGNILLGRGNKIEPANYWAIDVSQHALSVGQRTHPEAHFIFYDRYNFEFNETGTVGLPIPDPGVRFDLVLAFSVFTHTSKSEMLELVPQLQALLVDGGTLAFTFLDPNWVAPYNRYDTGEPPGSTNLHWGLFRRRDVNPDLDLDRLLALAAEQPKLDWVTLVNNEELLFGPDNDGISSKKPNKVYLTFCTAEYMRELYPRAEIKEPVPPEWQHCVVMGKSA